MLTKCCGVEVVDNEMWCPWCHKRIEEIAMRELRIPIPIGGDMKERLYTPLPYARSSTGRASTLSSSDAGSIPVGRIIFWYTM